MIKYCYTCIYLEHKYLGGLTKKYYCKKLKKFVIPTDGILCSFYEWGKNDDELDLEVDLEEDDGGQGKKAY